MRYVADSFAWQPKDWLDQPLHFAGGAGGVMLIMLLSRAWWVALLGFTFVVAAGALREYGQHPETRVILNLDLTFIVAGAGFATHVMLI